MNKLARPPATWMLLLAAATGFRVLTQSMAASEAAEYGTVTVAGQTYRDVIGTCLLHPFLTDAELEIYFTDTRGRVTTRDGRVMFFYPGITQILVGGDPLPILRSGPNLVEVSMPTGTHDVEIVGSPDMADARLPRNLVGPAPDTIDTLEEFKTRAATLTPGDEIIVRNGVYSGWADVVVSGAGTEENPIVIRPETPGGVVFRRRTHIRIEGSHIVFRGFRFDHAGPAHLLYLTECENIRVTQCQFFHCGNPASTYTQIIRLAANCHRSRVDHCFFTGSKSISLGLRIFNDETAGRHNRFDHNVFRDIVRFWSNGQENIQLGGSVAEAHCTVENCLFDHAWGDSEIISNKSSRNVIRYNVAAHCLSSAFTLRAGDGVRFEGNVMTNNAGGLTVYGRQHVVVNNLFVNLRQRGIALQAGCEDNRLRTAAEDTLIANNTFINCRGGAIGGEAASATDPRPVRNSKIIGNLMTGNRGMLLDNPHTVDPDVSHNLVWAMDDSTVGDPGRNAVLRDPRMEGSGVAIQPSEESPAIDTGIALDEVSLDRWQRRRPHGSAPDIGADEVGSGQRSCYLLSDIPLPPVLSPDLYKGKLAISLARNAKAGNIELVDETMNVTQEVPRDFVIEWEYLAGDFASEVSLVFATEPGSEGYSITWGGIDEEGIPVGTITLRKGESGEAVADGPDTLRHRMKYRLGSRRTIPDKRQLQDWYVFTLIKRRGLIWLALKPPIDFPGAPVVPVLVWNDDGLVGGPPLVGSVVRIEQKGPGRWRNVNVWQLASAEPMDPPQPKQLTAESNGAGRVALRWHHGRPGGVETVYEIYRCTAPDFPPAKEVCIAYHVRTTGYDDFDVRERQRYHYRVRARNAFGMTSDYASLEVTSGAVGPFYLHCPASSAQNVKAPLMVHEDPNAGEAFLWAPLHAGSAWETPPEDGLAEFRFRIPTDGRYAIWLSTTAANHSQDSFYYSLDARSLDSYRSISASVQGTWTWRRTIELPMLAGEHVFRIKHREPGAKLKAVLITDDLRLKPM